MSVLDFYYEFREAEYEPGLTKLKTKRFPTGAAGTPNDVKWGNNDNVWFTGAANCVGRFDNARKLTIFPRKVGHMPTLMSRDQHPLNFEYGWRFLDPVSRRIGFIDQFGKYHEELELEPGLTPTMFGPGKGLFQCGLVATDAGIVVDLVQNKWFQMRTPKVDAIGLALDSLWQISDSRLTCFAPGYSTGGRSLTLEGGYSKPGYMVAGGPTNTYLIYMDPGRDVIGFIEGYDKVLEVKLPAGTGIRAMHVSTDMTIWFTGKGGKSLFQLDRKRTVIEYPCVTNSDLFHIDSGSQCLWFTEPKHNCVTFADISTL